MWPATRDTPVSVSCCSCDSGVDIPAIKARDGGVVALLAVRFQPRGVVWVESALPDTIVVNYAMVKAPSASPIREIGGHL